MKLIMESWKKFLKEQKPPIEAFRSSFPAREKLSRFGKYHKNKQSETKFPWAHEPDDPGDIKQGAPAGESAKQMQRGADYLRNLIFNNVATGKIPQKTLPKAFQNRWRVNMTHHGWPRYLRRDDGVTAVQFAAASIEVKDWEYFGDGRITFIARGFVKQDGRAVDKESAVDYKMTASELAEYEKIRPYAKKIRLWYLAHKKMEKDPDFSNLRRKPS